MTPRPLTTTTEREEATRLVRFQSRHTIDPEYPRITRFENFCRVCGIAVHPIKGGWRHDLGEAEVLLKVYADQTDAAR